MSYFNLKMAKKQAYFYQLHNEFNTLKSLIINYIDCEILIILDVDFYDNVLVKKDLPLISNSEYVRPQKEDSRN